MAAAHTLARTHGGSPVPCRKVVENANPPARRGCPVRQTETSCRGGSFAACAVRLTPQVAQLYWTALRCLARHRFGAAPSRPLRGSGGPLAKDSQNLSPSSKIHNGAVHRPSARPTRLSWNNLRLPRRKSLKALPISALRALGRDRKYEICDRYCGCRDRNYGGTAAIPAIQARLRQQLCRALLFPAQPHLPTTSCLLIQRNSPQRPAGEEAFVAPAETTSRVSGGLDHQNAAPGPPPESPSPASGSWAGRAAAVGAVGLSGRFAVPSAAPFRGRTVSHFAGERHPLWRETRELLWISQVSRRYKPTKASPCTWGVHGPLDCLRTILVQNNTNHVIH
jgi:hypothetical protein